MITRTREYHLPLLSKINDFMIAKAQQHQLHTAPLTSTRLLSLTAHFTKLQPTRNPLTPNNSQFNIGCNITSTRLILHIYTVSDSFELWLSFSICHGWSWWAGLTHSVCSLSFPWTASVQKKLPQFPTIPRGRTLSHAPDLKAETRFIRCKQHNGWISFHT